LGLLGRSWSTGTEEKAKDAGCRTRKKKSKKKSPRLAPRLGKKGSRLKRKKKRRKKKRVARLQKTYRRRKTHIPLQIGGEGKSTVGCPRRISDRLLGKFLTRKGGKE